MNNALCILHSASCILPRLVSELRIITTTHNAIPENHQYRRLLAQAYHVSSAILTKLGRSDLAWIAADRGFALAVEAEDFTVIMSLARSVAHALFANGQAESAMKLVTQSHHEAHQQGHHQSQLEVSNLGSLCLVGAMAGARLGCAQESRAWLSQARRLSQQLGRDANHGWTSFGPTNVKMHEVSVAVELGDIQQACALSSSFTADGQPTERRIRHHLEVARIYSLTGRAGEALALLLESEKNAPDHVRSHYLTRVVTGKLLLQSTRSDANLLALGRRLKILE